MRQLHLARVAYAAPLIAALKDAGAPVNRLLGESGLHRFKTQDPDALLPAQCLHDLIEIVARRETGSNLPSEISSRYVLANMGSFGAMALQCPDVQALFLLAGRPDARQLSYETITLGVRGIHSSVSDVLAIPPSIARRWLEIMSIALMVDAIRTVAGLARLGRSPAASLALGHAHLGARIRSGRTARIAQARTQG